MKVNNKAAISFVEASENSEEYKAFLRGQMPPGPDSFVIISEDKLVPSGPDSHFSPYSVLLNTFGENFSVLLLIDFYKIHHTGWIL